MDKEIQTLPDAKSEVVAGSLNLARGAISRVESNLSYITRLHQLLMQIYLETNEEHIRKMIEETKFYEENTKGPGN